MSSKARVYEVAKDLGLGNNDLVELLQSFGETEVKTHMSVVSPEEIEKVKRHLDRRSASDKEPVVEERIRPTVVKRKSTRRKDEPETPESPARVEAAPVPAPEPAVVRRTAAGVKPASAPREASTSASEAHTPAQVAVPPRQPEAPAAAPAPRDLPVETKAAPAPVEASAPAVKASVAEEAVKAAAPVVEPAPKAVEVKTEVAPPPAATPSAAAAPAPAVEAGAAVAPAPAVAPAAAAVPAPAIAAETKTVSAEVPAAKPAASEALPPAAAEAKSVKTEAAPAVEAPKEKSTVTAEAKVQPAAPPVAAPPVQQPSASAHSAAPRPSTPPGTPSTPPGSPSTPPGARPSQPPVKKTGIEVWEGRAGVPMHQHRAAASAVAPRRTTFDTRGQGAPGRGGRGAPVGRGGFRGGRGQRGGGGGIASFAQKRGAGQMVTQERSAHKKVVRIEETIGVQALGIKMGIKVYELLRALMKLGMTGVNINTTLDADTAKLLANEFGWEVEDVAVSEEEQLVQAQGRDEDDDDQAEPRPPVITVMGHVDHGKTSLLDAMRKTRVVEGEAGGITQHVGAYSVELPKGRITVLDTPGHAAFTAMRARGAQATDIIVLVVAADDGVMPQTKEAISHAKAAGVPIVVAVNKCDKPEAQPERVRRELSEQGLVPEEWGGQVLFAEVSAKTGVGIPELLERVLLQAEMLELRANPHRLATGTVIEAQLDRGRGPVATVLVTGGTLQRGDAIVAGAAWGKIRAMQDSDGVPQKDAGPSTPVVVIGLSDVPNAGDPVYVVKDVKTAQALSESRRTKERKSLLPGGPRVMSFDEVVRAMQTKDQLEVKLIIKADVQGSVGALSDSLVALSTEKVRVNVVHSGAGSITEGDVNLASAAGAIIIGFNVRPAGKAAAVAAQEKIEIRQYSIIYNVLDDVRSVMEGMLAPTLVERPIGDAEVRAVFNITKSGTIAGCMVTNGLVRRNAHAKLEREGKQVWEGKLTSLKRFKEDVREVKEGFECGISLDGMDAIQNGDIIHVFEMEEVRQSL